MVNNVALSVTEVGKCYYLFDKPHQRLLSYFFRRYEKYATAFWALKSLSFTLTKGETIGIIGRNGSGKSTLLQMVAGTLSSSEGEIACQGRIAALLELGAGFNPEFTGRENIRLNAAIYGLSTAEIDERIADIIAFAELGDFIDQPVAHYSSGMFVRLAFSVIAHVDADVLIIDEALAVGDAAFSQKCMRFLESFKKTGSILFVSHDAGTVTQLCDRAIWLDKGEMRLIGDANEVSEAYIEHIYAQQQTIRSNPEAANKDALAIADTLDFESWHDARDEVLRHSNLRNDIQLMAFNPDGEWFGTGDIRIDDVAFYDAANRRLSWMVGGTKVLLMVRFTALADIASIIVGFMIKNRKGQVLFGENNYVTHQDSPIDVVENTAYCARFGMTMPYLPEDDYVVTIAIASGSQVTHVQHCWQHEAVVFTVTQGHVVHGLMGIPLGFCDITQVGADD